MEHIIWSNIGIDIKDWADFLQEEYPDVTDPEKQYELFCVMNRTIWMTRRRTSTWSCPMRLSVLLTWDCGTVGVWGTT